MISVVLYGPWKLLVSPSTCKSNTAQSKRKWNLNLLRGEIKLGCCVLKPKRNDWLSFPSGREKDFMCSVSFALQSRMGILFLCVFDTQRISDLT